MPGKSEEIPIHKHVDNITSTNLAAQAVREGLYEVLGVDDPDKPRPPRIPDGAS